MAPPGANVDGARSSGDERTAGAAAVAPVGSALEHLPISFFSVVMGLSGLAIAWEKASTLARVPPVLPGAIAAIATGVFITVASAYALKALRYRAAVADELAHPIKLNFFPTISISLILLSIALLPYSVGVSFVLWGSGTALQLVLLLFVMNRWMHHESARIEHLNPAWFIPAVGNVLVPLAGVPHGYIEISWFFFSIGLLFWLVLLGIIFNRILFHQPLPGRLQPTLFILIAPPAVGFIAWVRLTGSLDAFGHVLYDLALFFTLLLLTQAARFTRLPFFLTWWAYSFPLTAVTAASWLMYELTGLQGYLAIGVVLLTLATAVIGLLVVRTVAAMRRGEIFVPE